MGAPTWEEPVGGPSCPIPGQLAVFRVHMVGRAGLTQHSSRHARGRQGQTSQAPFSPDPSRAHLPTRLLPMGDPGGTHPGIPSHPHTKPAIHRHPPNSPARHPPHML